MKTWKPILLTALIAVLLAGNVYFCTQAQKPDWEIRVGRPISVPVVDGDGADLGRTTGVDFTKSKALTKAEVNTVILAFLGAESWANTGVAEDLPDALMELRIPQEDAVYYYQINLWQAPDAVVFAIGTESGSRYKAVTSPYYLEALTAILDRQLNP